MILTQHSIVDHVASSGCPCPALAASQLHAGCMIITITNNHYHLSLMILTQRSIADLLALSGWPRPALAASRLHAGFMIIIIIIII